MVQVNTDFVSDGVVVDGNGTRHLFVPYNLRIGSLLQL